MDKSQEQIQEDSRLIAKIGSASSPSLSPDKTQIAFISNLAGFPQVWRMPVSGGFPERVTSSEDYVTKVSWSPSGEWLAFESAPGGGMNTQIYILRPDGTDLRQLSVGGLSNNWLGAWAKDNQSVYFTSNMDQPDAMLCYCINIETHDIRKLTNHVGTSRIEGFTPKSGQLIVNSVAYRGDNNIILIDLDTLEETLLTPHEPTAHFSNLKFSEDEENIYLISNRDSDLSEMVKFTLGKLADGTVLCSRQDAELEQFVMSSDEKLVALSWNIAGRTELELFNLETNTSITILDLPCETAKVSSFFDDDNSLLLTLTGSMAPSDIWILDVASHALKQLTTSPHAGVKLSDLVSPTLETYRGHDDLHLSGWLYLPRDMQPPFPMVLSFHGGPEGQDRPVFRADYQALLAQGMGVFAPNVRGSSGFGKKFLNLDNGALRINAIRDIQSSVDYLIEGGIAISGKIGIMGGSYGGYMTMAGLVEYPDLFAAGVNIYGVVNFKTFFEKTEPWMASISKIEYGDPDTEADMLDELSPMTNIDRVIAPTLVLHGANDTNVPVHEAEQVVQKLQEQTIPVEYVLFPDEGHGFQNEKNRITATSATVNWFLKYFADV